MKRLAMCLAALAIPAAAFGQDVNSNVNMFMTAPSYSGCADGAFEQIDAGGCADLVSSGPGTVQAFVWVVASREGGYSDGIGGLQFGLSHDLAAGGWTLCTGGSEIPEAGFPASGTGNAVTWAGGCYNSSGTAARVGFVTVSDETVGSVQVTEDPRTGVAEWADCSAVLYGICRENLGGATLADGTSPVCGDNCETVPVETTSWSSIKSLY